MSSSFSILSARADIFFTASRMPTALLRVEMIYKADLNISAPGFSSYMPVKTGMPSSFLTASQIAPQATP